MLENVNPFASSFLALTPVENVLKHDETQPSEGSPKSDDLRLGAVVTLQLSCQLIRRDETAWVLASVKQTRQREIIPLIVKSQKQRI